MGVPFPSGSPVPGGAAHINSEDESVDAREVDMLLRGIGVILGPMLIILWFSRMEMLGKS